MCGCGKPVLTPTPKTYILSQPVGPNSPFFNQLEEGLKLHLSQEHYQTLNHLRNVKAITINAVELGPFSPKWFSSNPDEPFCGASISKIIGLKAAADALDLGFTEFIEGDVSTQDGLTTNDLRKMVYESNNAATCRVFNNVNRSAEKADPTFTRGSFANNQTGCFTNYSMRQNSFEGLWVGRIYGARQNRCPQSNLDSKRCAHPPTLKRDGIYLGTQQLTGRHLSQFYVSLFYEELAPGHHHWIQGAMDYPYHLARPLIFNRGIKAVLESSSTLPQRVFRKSGSTRFRGINSFTGCNGDSLLATFTNKGIALNVVCNETLSSTSQFNKCTHNFIENVFRALTLSLGV